jgi:hypothetical protein
VAAKASTGTIQIINKSAKRAFISERPFFIAQIKEVRILKKDKCSDKEKKRRRKWPYILLLLLHGCGQEKLKHGGPTPCPSSSEIPSPGPSSSSLNDTGSALLGGSNTPSRQNILSQLQKQQVTVTDHVSAQVFFPSGSTGTTGAWTVENPPSNNVIMQCEIICNGKSIAKSVPIYPGQHIDSLTLSQPVTPGNYNVTATIRYYNKTTKAYLGMADYGIHMSVS